MKWEHISRLQIRIRSTNTIKWKLNYIILFNGCFYVLEVYSAMFLDFLSLQLQQTLNHYIYFTNVYRRNTTTPACKHRIFSVVATRFSYMVAVPNTHLSLRTTFQKVPF